MAIRRQTRATHLLQGRERPSLSIMDEHQKEEQSNLQTTRQKRPSLSARDKSQKGEQSNSHSASGERSPLLARDEAFRKRRETHNLQSLSARDKKPEERGWRAK